MLRSRIIAGLGATVEEIELRSITRLEVDPEKYADDAWLQVAIDLVLIILPF